MTSIIKEPLRLCLFSQQVCALRVCTLLVVLMSLAALQWVAASKRFLPDVRTKLLFINDSEFHTSRAPTLKGQHALLISVGDKVSKNVLRGALTTVV